MTRAPVIVRSSRWVRAPKSGVFRSFKPSGAIVEKDELLAVVSDPFGERETEVRSRDEGMIIGRATMPIVNEGDALFHIAQLERPGTAAQRVEKIGQALDGDPMFDEDEIL